MVNWKKLLDLFHWRNFFHWIHQSRKKYHQRFIKWHQDTIRRLKIKKENSSHLLNAWAQIRFDWHQHKLAEHQYHLQKAKLKAEEHHLKKELT